MAFADDVVAWSQRFQANLPQASLSPQSRFYTLGVSFLTNLGSMTTLINSAADKMYVATATGTALQNLAPNYGVAVGLGTATVAQLTFSLPTPQSATVNIPQGTQANTGGDGITVPSVTFATQQAGSIPAGAPNSNSNQIETVTITGSPTGGGFQLTHAGQQTVSIDHAATAAVVQTALQNLSNVGVSAVTGLPNVAVTGAAGGPYTVTWQQALGGTVFSAMSAVNTFTGGTSPSVASTITSASAPTITAQATTTGSAGNVAAGGITTLTQPLGGGAVEVTNPPQGAGNAFGYITAGSDADSDQTILTNINAQLAPSTTVLKIQKAAKAITPVYDTWCYDPQDGSNTVTLYWSDVNGNSNTVGTTPPCWKSDGTGTLQVAVAAVAPPGITVTYTGFTITAVSVALTYSCDSGIASSYIEPLITAAIQSFINGLVHGQAAQPALMFQYVQQQVGFVLTNWVATITPSSAGVPVNPPTTTSNHTLYRYVAGTSTIAVTRA